MEGVSGRGAWISILSPASSAVLRVEAPKTAIRVVPCLKSEKFLKRDSTPAGLKKAITSYFTSFKSVISA